MATSRNQIRDSLRFDAAVKATQLALDKWLVVAYGANALEDEYKRENARALYNELRRALTRAELNARP